MAHNHEGNEKTDIGLYSPNYRKNNLRIVKVVLDKLTNMT